MYFIKEVRLNLNVHVYSKKITTMFPKIVYAGVYGIIVGLTLSSLKSPEHGLDINIGKIYTIPKSLNNCTIEHKQ